MPGYLSANVSSLEARTGELECLVSKRKGNKQNGKDQWDRIMSGYKTEGKDCERYTVLPLYPTVYAGEERISKGGKTDSSAEFLWVAISGA